MPCRIITCAESFVTCSVHVRDELRRVWHLHGFSFNRIVFPPYESYEKFIVVREVHWETGLRCRGDVRLHRRMNELEQPWPTFVACGWLRSAFERTLNCGYMGVDHGGYGWGQVRSPPEFGAGDCPPDFVMLPNFKHQITCITT